MLERAPVVTDHPESQSPPRRIPSQRRSRERVERMLAAATGLIEQGGSDSMRMSDVADLAEVSIGSLYQYFPDKASIIRTLAERYNAEGRACVAAELVKVQTAADLPDALAYSVDGYYAQFLQEPVMRDIWSGTQADKTLQDLDLEDISQHAAMVLEVMERVWPDADRAELSTSAFLMMHLTAATVRLAISVERSDGDALIAAFKRMMLREIRFECDVS